MKKTKELNIDAVAMIRKIRDDNYKRCRGMSIQERLTDIRKRAERVNKKLHVTPKKRSTEKELVYA
jgi:hypothetical protein